MGLVSAVFYLGLVFLILAVICIGISIWLFVSYSRQTTKNENYLIWGIILLIIFLVFVIVGPGLMYRGYRYTSANGASIVVTR